MDRNKRAIRPFFHAKKGEGLRPLLSTSINRPSRRRERHLSPLLPGKGTVLPMLGITLVFCRSRTLALLDHLLPIFSMHRKWFCIPSANHSCHMKKLRPFLYLDRPYEGSEVFGASKNAGIRLRCVSDNSSALPFENK